jgi:uncharacterized RDD family membrane protein YckC
MPLEDDKSKISSRFSISLIVSFIIVVLAIIVIAAIFASFFGGLAYYLGDGNWAGDQRRDQLIDDILGGTWRYSSAPLMITLIIYSFLFLGRLADTE